MAEEGLTRGGAGLRARFRTFLEWLAIVAMAAAVVAVVAPVWWHSDWIGRSLAPIGGIAVAVMLIYLLVLLEERGEVLLIEGLTWAAGGIGLVMLFFFFPTHGLFADAMLPVVKEYWAPIARRLLMPFEAWGWPARFLAAAGCGFAVPYLSDAWRSRRVIALPVWAKERGFPLSCTLALVGGLAVGWLVSGGGRPW